MSFPVRMIIIIATAFAVIKILQVFGVFERNPGASKAKDRVDDTRKLRKTQKRANTKMSFYALPCIMFRNILLPKRKEEEFTRWLTRLDIREKTLDRVYTAEEYMGKQALPFLLSFLTIPLIVAHSAFWLILPGVTLVWLLFQSRQLKLRILDEDQILDNNFLDIYLLLYSQLKAGSRGRLRGTLENYLETLKTAANTDENDILKRFATYFLNLLTTNEDHEAVIKLRELYNSSVIINFCNVAGQALSGVDNADNLLTFKMQLTERKIKVMRDKQAKMVRSGERAVYLIYIILFIFIGIGWKSKLPTDMFDTMF